MQRFFITSTGTDVGKTLITASLAYQLQKAGKNVRALKPVMSGFDKDTVENSDAATLLQAQEIDITDENIASISPYRFIAPLSPDMAAAQEGEKIVLDDLVAYCQQHENHDEYLLVEGVGGVAVPLNEEHLISDWIKALHYQVVLVAGNYLGSLSHTLTALQAMLAKSITPHMIIITENVENGICPEHMIHSLKPHISTDIPIQIMPRITTQKPWQGAPCMLEWLL